MRGRVEAQRAKEASLWAARCKLIAERDELKRVIVQKDASLAADAVRIAGLRNDLSSAKTEMTALYASVSYRLGRALTKPFRVIRRLLNTEGRQ